MKQKVNKVTTISSATFANCTKLAWVSLGSSVEEIDESAFKGCSSLESITIPESVTFISRNAFNECTKLSAVTFADPSNWIVTTNVNMAGNSVSLSDTLTNANYLKNTYLNYYWKKL